MFTKSLLVSFALALGVAALSMQSQAKEFDTDVSCLKQDDLRSYLSRAFQETQFAEGILENGNPMGLFTSHAGTWTMVEFFDNGYGCIYGFGSGLLVGRRDHPKRPPS